jgi:hypothetical protein
VRRPDAARISQVSLANASLPAIGKRGSIDVGLTKTSMRVIPEDLDEDLLQLEHPMFPGSQTPIGSLKIQFSEDLSVDLPLANQLPGPWAIPPPLSKPFNGEK